MKDGVLTSYPIEGELVDKYFVERDHHVDYAVKFAIRASKGEVLGFCGPTGSGKTTLLNVIYEHIKDMMKVGKIRCWDELNFDNIPDDIDVLFLYDRIPGITEKERKAFYEIIKKAACERNIKVLFGDYCNYTSELEKVLEGRCQVTVVPISLDFEEMKAIVSERLRRGEAIDLLTPEALDNLVKISMGNMRCFFKYLGDAIVVIDNEEGITWNELKDAIRESDESMFRIMKPLQLAILKVLTERDWLGIRELIAAVHDLLNMKVSNRDIYRALNDLKMNGFIIERRVGRKREIASIHKVMGIVLRVPLKNSNYF